MRVTTLHCKGFRGLTNLAFEPEDGVNILRGHNAQGKTSVLESILYLATSRSHRTNSEAELVQHGAEGFSLKTEVLRSKTDVKVEANYWQGAKRFKINGVSQERISDILGRIHVILFSPEDVSLVKGSASYRRRFLDMELSQLHQGYLGALQQYRLILRQKNELLRKANSDTELLDVWDEQLATHGTLIGSHRTSFIEQLAKIAQIAYSEIADGEEMTISYNPDLRKDESLLEVLKKSRAADIRRGFTQRGPHRDDIEIAINGKRARSFASQGQQKTIALALKLAEYALVKDRIGESPVLMLDEVLAELDAKRQSQLFQFIDESAQCIVTTTHLGQDNPFFSRKCAKFVIKDGNLEKE